MPESSRIRCVAAIPFNDRGQILLQQRDESPNLLFPGCWTTFGGQIEDGETPDEAVRRELMEEIEITLDMKFWKLFDNPVQRLSGEVVIVEQYVFAGRVDIETSTIKLNEGQALGFFDYEDIDRLPIAFGFETLFKEFFAVRDTLFT